MPGFFSSADDISSGTAVADYGREYGDNPGAFDQGALGRLFDRLFAGQPKTGKITSAPLPPPTSPTAPTPSPAPSQKVAAVTPSISSGQGLIDRILKAVGGPPTHDALGNVLMPGTGMTPQQFQQTMGQSWQQSLQQAYEKGIQQALTTGAVGAPPATPPFDNRSRYAPPSVAQGVGAATPGFFSRGYQPPILQSAMPPSMQMTQLGQPQMSRFERGGPLRMMRGGYPENLIHGMPTRFASGDYVQPDGRGDGRSDHVPARLSPGEYVMDAETVSMLGNGDNEAGARKLDGMRHNLRVQKGRALAKGDFSPDAKQPEAYLRGQK